MSRRNVSWSTCLGDKRLVSEWRRAVFRKRRRCIAESRPRGTCLVGSVGSTVELGSRSSHWRVRSSEKKSPRAPSQFGESTVGKKTLPPVLQCAMHGIVGKSILRACAFSPPDHSSSHWMSRSERDFRLAGNGESESSSSIFTAKLPSCWLPLSLCRLIFSFNGNHHHHTRHPQHKQSK